MTDVLGVLAYLLLPLIGVFIWRVEGVRGMGVAARVGIATGVGALCVAIVMAVFSVVGIEWSRGGIGLVVAVLVVSGIAASRRGKAVAGQRTPKRFALLGATAVPVLLSIYGTVTARQSCGDLAFTWGPKAIRWFRAGGIDVNVLKTWPQLTVDYPPLQTLLLAFSNTISQQFSWWAAVLAAPLFLMATLAVIRGMTGDDLGTLLVASTLAWTTAVAAAAGCAEPVLLLFEAIAICALTFVDHPRTQTLLVALGAAGAVFTKLEGTSFAVAVLLTILVVQRDARRFAIVAAAAATMFGSWMAFVFWNDLLYMYGGARMPIYWSTLPVVLTTLLKVAAFKTLWLPWIAPIVLIVLGDAKRALIPLSIAVLTLGATVYFYVHYPDPVWWIESSSPRVLMTPLLALMIGAIAAWRRPAI